MRVISGKASKFRIIPARWSAPDWRLKLGKLGAHHFENGFGKCRVCHLLPPRRRLLHCGGPFPGYPPGAAPDLAPSRSGASRPQCHAHSWSTR
jgi:hypothetical protein